MRILAIETATAHASVALLDGGALVREAAASVPQGHLEWLAPAIASLLEAAGWGPMDVDAVAVSTGPGTFTGLRIGISTAAAWAYARGVPVVGISTLEVLAEGTAAATSGDDLICPVLDARREEVAFALFECRPRAARILDDAVGPVPALLARMPADRQIIFSGDGVPRLAGEIHLRPEWHPAPETVWSPRAAVTGAVGWRRLARGERDEPHLLRPVYARAAGITPSPWTSPGDAAGGNSPTTGGRLKT
jgi:tRNA threonylcarbamoyladenosine biosynthesis protein TsaB